jgi:hypothetical protein
MSFRAVRMAAFNIMIGDINNEERKKREETKEDHGIF